MKNKSLAAFTAIIFMFSIVGIAEAVTLTFQEPDFDWYHATYTDWDGATPYHIWYKGDYWTQTFNSTGLDKATNLTLNLVFNTWILAPNVPVYFDVLVNGIDVGDITIYASGYPDPVTMFTGDFSFSPIAGPTFSLKLVVKSDIDPPYSGSPSLVIADGVSYAELTAIPGLPEPERITKLVTADLNGDGQDDLAGLTSDGQIYYTLDLSTWNQIQGSLNQLITGDFNGDGNADLAGLTSDGQIYYTIDLETWVHIQGVLNQLVAGDLNRDGADDLAGLAGDGSIYYTINFADWVVIPGRLAQMTTGNLTQASEEQLVGSTDSGQLFMSLNLSSWTNIPAPH